MVEEFEGYRVGDITYCVDPETDECFPVRVVKIGRRFVDVESYDAELTIVVVPDFMSEQKNRRFVRPRLPNQAQFGGFDERTVNSERLSGPELRLLPFHYATLTGAKIRKRHAVDPSRWPLPTGTVYERWFKDAKS